MADHVERAKATPAGVGVVFLVAGLGMTLQAIALPAESSWARWLGLVVLGAGAALYAGAKVKSR